MMSKKELFKNALNYQAVSPVPYNIKFTQEAKKNFAEYLGKTFDPVEYTGSYVVASHTNKGWEQIKPGYFKDYFGVVWNKTVDKTLGIVDQPPITTPSFDNFSFPSTDDLPVYRFIEDNNIRYPDHFHMLSIGFMLFERAWSLVGMEQLMIWLMMEPDFINDLLDRITEYNIKVIEQGAAIGGLDAVHFGDDWGAQNGLLISPEMWRAFIKPRFAKTCQRAKELGLLVSHHCCGKVEELIPDMIEAGVDVFDPFQPEVMDIWALHKNYTGKIAFWGGLSVQNTLPLGTPENVIEEGEKLLQNMGSKGGYIFAPSHALTGDIPPKNIEALIDLAQNQKNV